MTDSCGPTAATRPAAAPAAKTKPAVGSFQTCLPRLTTHLLVRALLLLQLCSLVCRVHPVAAVERQRTPSVAWEAGGEGEAGSTTVAPLASTGKVASIAQHQLAAQYQLARDGEDPEEGVGRRCWISEDGRRKCYANVFFFGVSKCGTTTLASWMAHHPTLRWVSNSGHLGQKGFEAHVMYHYTAIIKPDLLPTSTLRYAALAPEAEEGDRVIDYTPHYAIVPEVPYRIRRLYGNSSFDGSTKYLVSLREPAARAVSSWEYKFNMYALSKNADPTKVSGEARPLEVAIREGIEDVNGLLGCLEQYPRPPLPLELDYIKELDLHKCHTQAYWGDNNRLLRHHIGNGMYALHLERWFAVVGRENVKVLFLEEINDDPVKTLEGIFDFIGLNLLDSAAKKGLANREEWERIVQTRDNITEDKRKRALGPQVTPELVQEMRDFFAPHNSRLEKLLGRPVPDSWSTPAAS